MGERYDISRHTEKSWIVTMVELVDHPIRICSLKCDMLQSSQVKVRISSYANNDSKKLSPEKATITSRKHCLSSGSSCSALVSSFVHPFEQTQSPSMTYARQHNHRQRSRSHFSSHGSASWTRAHEVANDQRVAWQR